MPANASPEVPLDRASEEPEFGLEQAKQLAGLFVRAPRRHGRLAFASLVVTLAVGIAVALLWPRTFACTTRILAQRNLVLPALDDPSRAIPHDAENPTRNAGDAILNHDNIVALIDELDLVERSQSSRPPLLRLKDRLTSFGPPRPHDERVRDMVEVLYKRLSVVTDDTSITISAEWPDREIAFDLVSFLQKNFLEARYDSNVSVIMEAIRILEERAKPEAAEVDEALANLTKIESERAAALQTAPDRPTSPDRPIRVPRQGAAPTAARSSSASAPSAPLDGDAQELEDVRRRIRTVQDEHDRQLAQARSALADARATLGPMHPTVLGLNEKLEQLDQPPPELASLTAKERELMARIAGTPSPAPSPASSAPAAAASAAPAPPVREAPPHASSALPISVRDDPQVTVAMTRLQAASGKYNELLSRIEAANIELDVTRAAFKYQYTVTRPPELPRGPSKPNVLLVLVATVVLSALLTFLVPGLLDLWRGRFVEAWQVERELEIPLLGQLEAPRQ